MAGKASQEGLVAMAVTSMRQLVLGQEPETQLGSLPDIAKKVGVGVVTIRQAARVLEHEGFLKVRRGNNGGFYGTRPNAAALGRAVAGFMEVSRTHEREAIEITTLLDCDLMAAAAVSTDEELRDSLQELGGQIATCDTAEQRATFVQDMHEVIFKMVDRPLMEMMVRMAMQHQTNRSGSPIYSGADAIECWKQQRRGIIDAILRRDAGLARFEAQRRRDYVLQQTENSGLV
jgi:GntR family transcriptional repressor for pyruvate dehydrogenase complex